MSELNPPTSHSMKYLSAIPNNVDTSQKGAGNVTREISRLRRQIAKVAEIKEDQQAISTEDRLKSPYFTDRHQETLVHGSGSENNWRKDINLKKLNII